MTSVSEAVAAPRVYILFNDTHSCAHTEEVVMFAITLRRNGIDAMLSMWVDKAADENWKDQEMQKADKVVFVEPRTSIGSVMLLLKSRGSNLAEKDVFFVRCSCLRNVEGNGQLCYHIEDNLDILICNIFGVPYERHSITPIGSMPEHVKHALAKQRSSKRSRPE